MRDIIVTLGILSSLPYIWIKPHIGIYMWSVIAYLNPHRLTWGFAYNFPFAAIIAGVTLLSLLFSKEKKSMPWMPLTIIWLFMVIWFSITTMFAMVPDVAVEEWNRFIKIQLFAFLALMLCQSKKRIDGLIIVIVVSIGFFGLKGAIFTIITGGQWSVVGPPDSFIAGNNEIGFAMMLVLPMVFYLRSQVKKRYLKIALVILMISMLISILATYSRGALISISVIAMYFVLRHKQRIRLLIGISIFAFAILNFLPEQWMERMNTIDDYEEDESMGGRYNAWYFAYYLALDHPFMGGGFRVFDPSVFHLYAPDPDDYHDSHSIYFEVLGEQGFVGLALFLSLALLSFLKTIQIRRLTKGVDSLKWAYDLGLFLQVCLIGYATGGIVIGMAYFHLLYHIIGLIVLTYVVSKRELEKMKLADATDNSDGAGESSSPLPLRNTGV